MLSGFSLLPSACFCLHFMSKYKIFFHFVKSVMDINVSSSWNTPNIYSISFWWVNHQTYHKKKRICVTSKYLNYRFIELCLPTDCLEQFHSPIFGYLSIHINEAVSSNDHPICQGKRLRDWSSASVLFIIPHRFS